MPRYAGRVLRQSGRFISRTPSGRLTPGFCASRRRPVSTRANLEIKFQRIRLGMPSTLYESQTNLPALPLFPPFSLQPLNFPAFLSAVFSAPSTSPSRGKERRRLRESRMSRKDIPSLSPVIRPTGRSVATKYRKQYLFFSP